MTRQIALFLYWRDRELQPCRTPPRQLPARLGLPRGDHPRVRLNRWLATIGDLWRLWRRRAHERQQILRFTERELRDAGLTTGDVYRELATPFWRADPAGGAPAARARRAKFTD
jgi:uncharacterized protein YjiS (DUF1127 family)